MNNSFMFLGPLPAPCPACGYDLRGNIEAERCSECGCTVADVLAEVDRDAQASVKALQGIAIVTLSAMGLIAASLILVFLVPGIDVIPRVISFVFLAIGTIAFTSIAFLGPRDRRHGRMAEFLRKYEWDRWLLVNLALLVGGYVSLAVISMLS